jgi:hypothetical protein
MDPTLGVFAIDVCKMYTRDLHPDSPSPSERCQAMIERERRLADALHGAVEERTRRAL